MLALLALLLVGACDSSNVGRQHHVGGGDARRGARLVSAYGCGSCHEIPGIRGAHGMVGPPLGTIGRRAIIAGVLPNTPNNLVTWLKVPQSVVPGNAMPNMGISDDEAHDIAAFLYTQR